ncbi:hypothetical protein EBU99_10730 [bacterium]|nr:hypothetical protein [bacterium]
MDVHTRSVLILTLAVVANAAWAAEFHESLVAGTICSSENSLIKTEILEAPADDGFFKLSEDGLCRALPLNPNEPSTLFDVANCMLADGTQLTLMFGGWLNMLTARFDENSGIEDLICR